MNTRPLYAHMKLGTVHFKAFPEVEFGQGPMVDALKKIAEDDFFTAVEIGPSRDVRVRHQVRLLSGKDPGDANRAEAKKVFTETLREILDYGLLNPQDPPVVSIEVRPLLAEEYSEIIIANAKRVIRQAWAGL